MAVPLASAGELVELAPEVDPEPGLDVPELPELELPVVAGAGALVPVEVAGVGVAALLAFGLGVVSLGAALVDTALTVGVAAGLEARGVGEVTAVSVATGAANVAEG